MKLQNRVLQAVVALALVLAVGAGVWLGVRPASQPGGGYGWRAEAAEVVVVPERSDALGMDPDSAFLLTSRVPLSAEMVRKNLVISPQVGFNLTMLDQEGKQYRIQPEIPLSTDSIYRLELLAGRVSEAEGEPGNQGDGVTGQQALSRDYRWAFQTRGDFRVLGTLPRHTSAHVPLNTGIEVVFSHEGVADLTPYFDIQPRVEGRFEYHKKVAVFVPKELQPGTLYTVTVKAGAGVRGSATGLAADYVFQFETEPEAGPGQQGYFYLFQREYEFAEREIPALSVTYDQGGRSNAGEVQVTLYRFAGPQDYVQALARVQDIPPWAYTSRGKFMVDTRGLHRIMDYTAAIQNAPGGYPQLVVLPEPLPAGYFLAELSALGKKHQVWLQVTDLSAYTSVSRTETLVWLNDLVARGPAAGGRVQLLDSRDGRPSGNAVQADSSGVATLSTPASLWSGAKREDLFLLAQAGDAQTVIHIPAEAYYPYGGGQSNRAAEYWKYLYTDRSLYQPSDQVRFFGIVQPRERGAQPIKAVTVELTDQYSYWEDRQANPLASQRVAVQGNTFDGMISLPNLRPGTYFLQVRDGSDILLVRSFEVQTYTKPAYRFSVVPERRAVFAGEQAVFHVSTRFFEGTPVSDLAVNYQFGGKSGTVVTGLDGEARVAVEAGFEGYGPFRQTAMNISAQLPEAGDIYSWQAVMVFDYNIYLQSSVKREGDRAVLSFQANRVTLDRINRGEQENYWDFKGEAAAGRVIRGEVLEHITRKVETGEVYDYINKVVVKQYTYQSEQVPLFNFEVTTGAAGEARYDFPVHPEKTYIVRITAQDYNNRTIRQDQWLRGSLSPADEEDYPWYHLEVPEDKRSGFRPGEEVLVEMRRNNNKAGDRPAGYLFYTARRGLTGYRVQDNPVYAGSFQAEDIPNYYLYGVYFDGRQYYQAERTVAIDPQARALKVRINPGQAVYRPGETARMTVNVTDQAGRPVQARVNLSLVDEAVHYLSDQWVDLLNSLYRDLVPSWVVRHQSSHRLPDRGYGAEMGGEGDVGRTEFVDTAYFATVLTGADGKAQVDIKLPDNLTSWRLTYHAVTGKMEAASGSILIPVKLPFFVELTMNTTYLAGDRPEVVVRAYGEKIGRGETVDYTLKLTGPDNQVITRQVGGQAFQPVRLPLPELQEGKYRVTVTGRSKGGLTDTLTLPLTVRSSYLVWDRTDFIPLQPGIKLAGSADRPTRVTFVDYQRGFYLHVLESLAHTGGNRLDQRLAAWIATGMLAAYFDRQGEEEVQLIKYQTNSGGLALLPYSDADLALSAKAAALRPDLFDREGLARYFQQVVDSREEDRERAITALFGLAALERPVLRQLHLAAGLPDLNLKERLYLALAFTLLGSDEDGRQLWNGVMADHGEELGAHLRVNSGRDQDEVVELTALAAVMASRLRHPDGDRLYRYVMEQQPRLELAILERLLYLDAALANLPEGERAAVVYAGPGSDPVTVNLAGGKTHTMLLAPADLAQLRILEVHGKAGAVTAYETALDLAQVKADPDLSLERFYFVKGREAGELQAGDIVEVVLTFKAADRAPDGTYGITDFLPAGLKPITDPWRRGVFEYGKPHEYYYTHPILVEGQRVSFQVTKSANKDEWNRILPTGARLRYFARVVSTGAFQAESAYILHLNANRVAGFTVRQQVVIK